MTYYAYYFGQAYGEGTYSSGTYSCTTEQQQAGTCVAATGSGTGSGTNGSGLADTGFAIAGIITLACLLVFIALVVRIWRRKPAAKAAHSETVVEPDSSVRTPQV